ncbi:hypothetical protein B0J12DRAFT_146842 [Macrophomina phaseolina]|uniref:Uncharacterized protein n=1 Tax=Macrophomina phaseolina TaxID=35725 RepID=A0ABQ8G8T5_9PEZI|nr:hypothetical protein B0J12DRAFT_146842 [Macrophomina phaseolina]
MSQIPLLTLLSSFFFFILRRSEDITGLVAIVVGSLSLNLRTVMEAMRRTNATITGLSIFIVILIRRMRKLSSTMVCERIRWCPQALSLYSFLISDRWARDTHGGKGRDVAVFGLV